MAGLVKDPNKKKVYTGPYETTQLPGGGTASIGGGGPDTPALDPNIPTITGNKDGTTTMNPAMAAIHEQATTPIAQQESQQYKDWINNPNSDPTAVANAQGLFKGRNPTNQEIQDLRTNKVMGKIHQNAVADYKAKQAAEMETAKNNQQAGTMTIRDADKLGLLGAKNRYSKDFVIFDGAGNPMQVDAGTYVASLNRQIQGQNEADKNRQSAESIATSRSGGLFKNRYQPVITKDGKNTESYSVIDTMTGQDVPPAGAVNTSDWTAADQARYSALEKQIQDDSAQIAQGDNKYGLFQWIGAGKSRQSRIDNAQKEMDQISSKYGSVQQPNAVSDADIQSRIPDITPQELGEVRQLLQQGKSLDEILAAAGM